MKKFEVLLDVAEQYKHFPFRQQMFAIYSVSKALNCQVFFEQIDNGPWHRWTVHTSDNRRMGTFELCSKIED